MPSTNPTPELAVKDNSGRRNAFGDVYARVKRWDEGEFGVLSARDEADLAAIVRKAKVFFPPSSRVLEIGFGNGGFLAYGRKRQWEMHGTEMNEILLKRARRNGFAVTQADNFNSLPKGYFDLVAAFDVLEHVPSCGIPDFLRDVRRVLKEGAVFIARFPNGDSPFGRFNQHGDPTHVTTIGKHKAKYFAEQAGFEALYIGGEPQPLWSDLPHLAYRLLALPLRGILNLALNFLFCAGDPKSLCSINLVMVLRLAETEPRSPANTGASE